MMRKLLVPVWLGLFLLGLLVHRLTGRTPRICFHGMRRLYGPTNGYFNRLALSMAQRARPLDPPKTLHGFLGDFSPAEVDAIVQRLDRDGYAIFDRPAPPELVQQLREFALTQPSMPMGSSEAVAYRDDPQRALRYDFPEQSILSLPAACRIALDGTFSTIAGAYFRCLPIYDFTAMWWTTRFGPKQYSQAAQEFHFDMDRLAFLKFFIYLSDVTLETGPHVFVSGSHVNKPGPLRDPVRFDDALVEAHYPGDAIKRLCGPAGTIFAVDTKGIHKGMPVVEGERLAFQVEFTTSRFGQNYPSPSVDPAVLASAGIVGPLDARVFGNIRQAA
jgi:hypothetical protein